MAGSSTDQYPEIGNLAADVLTKDYNFGQTYTVALGSSSGTEITATGEIRNQKFFGGINTAYNIGNATVNLKVDTKSNMSTKVTIRNILRGTQAAYSFKIPNNRPSKLDVQYRRNHTFFRSIIALYPTLNLELSAATEIKDLSFGGKVGLDTALSTKYDFGIALNKTDFALAFQLRRYNQERILMASYFHAVDRRHSVAAAMTHTHCGYCSHCATNRTIFAFGTCHLIDQFNTLKTRFWNDGRIAMSYQREWRPKSLMTFSAEYNTKAVLAYPFRFGLSLVLRP